MTIVHSNGHHAFLAFTDSLDIPAAAIAPWIMTQHHHCLRRPVAAAAQLGHKDSLRLWLGRAADILRAQDPRHVWRC